MQWRVHPDESGEFVRARQWDEFSLDDQARFLTDIFTGPHWRPGLGVLFDYRGLKVGLFPDPYKEKGFKTKPFLTSPKKPPTH